MADPPIDFEVVRRLQADVGGDRADLQPLIDVFLKEAEEILEGLGRAIAGKNASEVRRLAHSLKSASAMFGALRLSGEARDLESLGLSGKLDGALRILEGLKSQFRLVREALLDLPES